MSLKSVIALPSKDFHQDNKGALHGALFSWYCDDGTGHPVLKARRGGMWQGVAGHGAATVAEGNAESPCSPRCFL